jgi:hypothetical protein
MKTLLTITLLLAASAAQAGHGRVGFHHGLGYGYYGYLPAGCTAWPCMNNDARVLTVPQDMPFNTNPNWGRNCRSCADLSK